MGPENRPHPPRQPLSTAPGLFQGQPATEAMNKRSRTHSRRGYWGLSTSRNHFASPFQRPRAISRARKNLLDRRLRRRWDGWSICRLAPKGLASDLRPAKFMAIPKPGRGPRGSLFLAGIILSVCSEPPDRWEGGDEHPGVKLGLARPAGSTVRRTSNPSHPPFRLPPPSPFIPDAPEQTMMVIHARPTKSPREFQSATTGCKNRMGPDYRPTANGDAHAW